MTDRGIVGADDHIGDLSLMPNDHCLAVATASNAALDLQPPPTAPADRMIAPTDLDDRVDGNAGIQAWEAEKIGGQSGAPDPRFSSNWQAFVDHKIACGEWSATRRSSPTGPRSHQTKQAAGQR